jgi:hypothetical protein
MLRREYVGEDASIFDRLVTSLDVLLTLPEAYVCLPKIFSLPASELPQRGAEIFGVELAECSFLDRGVVDKISEEHDG